MSDHGMRISADGVSVLTGADKDMVVTSKLSMLKGSLSGSGVVSVPQNGTPQVVTIAHGLPNIPMVQGFWNDRDGDVFNPGDFYPLPVYIFGFGGTDFAFTLEADATNVTITFIADDFGAGGANIDFKYAYYIFIDKGRL